MSIDTAEKRYSMLEFGSGNMGMMFEVDGAVDLDDRQHLLGCYSGLAFATVVDLCWPLTIAIVNDNRTTILVSAIWHTTLTMTDTGVTTVSKGC